MALAPNDSKLPDESLAHAGSRPPRFHSDFGIALAIVAFCGVIYGITSTFPELPPALSSGMGPAVFPRLLLGLLVLLACLLAFSARGKQDEVREPLPAIVYWTALAMAAFMAVVWLAGMLVAMVLGFIGIGLLWGERRRATLVIAGFLLSASIYLMFVKGFAIPLPRGLLGDWLF